METFVVTLCGGQNALFYLVEIDVRADNIGQALAFAESVYGADRVYAVGPKA